MNMKKLFLFFLLTCAGSFVFAQNGGEPETPAYGNVYIYEEVVSGPGGEPEAVRVINASVGIVARDGGEPSPDWDKIETIRLEHGMTEEIKDGVVYFFVLPSHYTDTVLKTEKVILGAEAAFNFSKDLIQDEMVLFFSSKNAQGAYVTVYDGENIRGERGIQFVASLEGEGRTVLLLPF